LLLIESFCSLQYGVILVGCATGEIQDTLLDVSFREGDQPLGTGVGQEPRFFPRGSCRTRWSHETRRAGELLLTFACLLFVFL
jgi:hypothetical protein